MIAARILLVEDERIVALHLKQQLLALGYDVVADAASGQQALGLIAETRPDLVLMDINIEGDIDGIETASRIPPEFDLPVIFLTAYSEETTLKRARGILPYGYLIKPYSDRELHATIQVALERQRVAAALRESEDRLALAVETFELGIVDHNAQTGAAIVSPTLEQIVGAEIGSLSGSIENWRAKLLPDDLRKEERETENDISTRQERRPHWVRVRHASGEVRELRGVRRFFYDAEGRCQRIIGIYMDVTEQMRAHAEVEARGARLMELQKELNHVSRLSAMGELAASLAHELNQPLTAVGNSVGAIRLLMAPETPLDEVTHARILRAAQQAEAQALRAGEIIRRLRSFIARGEAATETESVAQLIEDALALALPNPSVANIEIRRELSPAADHVMADGVQIQQILVNLIRNASEAMREQAGPRTLTFSAAVEDGMALIGVSDNGPGVAPDVAERLFSPFFSTKNDGMGVGLSICRRIIEGHGGRMWLATPSDAGAAFYFTLHLAKASLKTLN